MLFSQLILKSFDLRTFYLNKLSTLGTDQMVMMFMSILMFKPHLPLTEIDFPGQTGFTDKLQRPIDGSITNTVILPLNYLIKIINGKMLLHLQKEMEKLFSLIGPPEVMLG